MGLSNVSVSNELPTVVRFGVFEADLLAGELRKKGIKVKIQSLPFHALTLLLSRPNEVVTREELRHALWPEDIFVDFDGGIRSAIKRLRDALGDSAENPIFIETLDRRGYRWIAPTTVTAITASIAAAEQRTANQTANQTKTSVDAGATSVRPAVIPIIHRVVEADDAAARASSSPALKVAYGMTIAALLCAGWLLVSRFQSAKARRNSPSAAPAEKSTVHPANQEARDFYLQGRYYWNKRTPDDLYKAVDYFTQAIVHDPNYSDAYVGLADCYNLMREYTVMPASEAYPRALAAAKKAVDLDESSSQAHASLAFVSFYGMWDAATADREFRRAIELDANNATAHHWYATYLQCVRRFDESLSEIGRAQALDPHSAAILSDKGILLWRAGHKEEALRLLRQLQEADPDSISTHRYLRMIYAETGDDVDYLAEIKKEAALTRDESLAAVTEAAEKGFAQGDKKGMLQSLAGQQGKLYREKKASPFSVAEAYARLGDGEKALLYLQICYDQHSDELANVAVDPAFNSLHSIPAFQQLLVKVGLPAVR